MINRIIKMTMLHYGGTSREKKNWVKGGGNVTFKCNFCRQIYKGSYYRVKAHLLKIKGAGVASCTKVSNENLVEMRRVVEEAEQRVKQYNLKQVPLPTSSAGTSNFDNSSSSAIDPKRRKGSIGSIEKALNMGAHEIVDNEIVRMFYTGGGGGGGGGGCLFTLLEILIMLVPLKVQVNF